MIKIISPKTFVKQNIPCGYAHTNSVVEHMLRNIDIRVCACEQDNNDVEVHITI